MDMTYKVWLSSQIGIDRQDAMCECTLTDGRIFSGRISRLGTPNDTWLAQQAKYAALRAGLDFRVITQDEFVALVHAHLFFGGADLNEQGDKPAEISPFQLRVNKVTY